MINDNDWPEVDPMTFHDPCGSDDPYCPGYCSDLLCPYYYCQAESQINNMVNDGRMKLKSKNMTLQIIKLHLEEIERRRKEVSKAEERFWRFWEKLLVDQGLHKRK